MFVYLDLIFEKGLFFLGFKNVNYVIVDWGYIIGWCDSDEVIWKRRSGGEIYFGYEMDVSIMYLDDIGKCLIIVI